MKITKNPYRNALDLVSVSFPHQGEIYISSRWLKKEKTEEIKKTEKDILFEDFMDHIKLTQWERDNMTTKWRKEFESTMSFSYFVACRKIEKIKDFIYSFF